MAVMHYACTPLDAFDRFEVAPASVTAISIEGTRRRLLYVNNTTLAALGSSSPAAHPAP
jgi:hypothetical protein